MKQILCQNCGVKPATYFYQENINGSKLELHLCPDCAAKLGVGEYQENLFSSFSMFTPPAAPAKKTAVCPLCGTTLEQIREKGKFGCSTCYDTFREKLDLTPYVGKGYEGKKQVKTPPSAPPAKSPAPSGEASVEQLKAELKQAVAEENYEQAAILRDKIRAREGR